jgi:MarR family transcriptional regulator, organic hydroperoxide resistance regulator
MHNPPITEYLAYLLAQADRQVNRQLDARLKASGVPVEQWRVLKVLSDKNGSSMGDLAEAVLMNHPTLTKIIDRMVSNALVYRRPDQADGRRVLIYLSDRGRELVAELDHMAIRHQAEIVRSYGNDRAAQLKHLLEHFILRTA